MGKTPPYVIWNETIRQPAAHAEPDGPSFLQRVKVLVPAASQKPTKVLYIMGLEQHLTDSWLTVPFLAFGSRPDTVILCAEHRGYGKSLFGDDQTDPGYVSIREALSDYHAVRAAYAARFPGEWIVYGCSYGGALAIHYAYLYPEDASVVISSSGVTSWNALLPEYDVAAKENLGEALYERLCVHIDHLTPAEPFSQNWYGRELLYAFVTGLCQYRENHRLLGLIGALAKLPTKPFLRMLKLLDRGFAQNAASEYAASNAKLRLTRAEAETCRYSWRVWRYQQAFATGTFWAPAFPRSIYRRSEADWAEECRRLFGRAPSVFSAGIHWNVYDMAMQLKIPLIYVRGGRDPWRRVGLEPDAPLGRGAVLDIPDGFHGPDRYPGMGLSVFEQALSYCNMTNREETT